MNISPSRPMTRDERVAFMAYADELVHSRSMRMEEFGTSGFPPAGILPSAENIQRALAWYHKRDNDAD